MNTTYTYIGIPNTKSAQSRRIFSLSLWRWWCLLVILGAFLLPTLSHAQVTLSGTLYSDAGTTPQAVSKFIAVAVGTSTPNVFASTTLTTTGAWTVTIPAGHGIGTSTPIIVWVNDDATIKASVLTKASSSASVQSITGLDLYQSRVIARHEGSGTSTTFADFAFYTSAQDSDLQHSTSSGLLTIAPGNELYIWGGDTFAPGSNVTVLGNASASSTDGSMYLGANSVYTAGGALQLAGSLTAESSATFTGGVHTTTFNATTTGKTIDAPIASLGNVTFNGAGGAWSFADNATTTNLTVLRGTVSTPGVTVSVTGTYQNDATFNAGSGALNVVGATTPVLADFISLTTARDAAGMVASTSPTSTTAFAIAGNTLYIAKAGGSQGCGSAASTTAGNCELMVYNIASTTNPVFVTARDSGGSNASTSNVGINAMTVAGSMLYVAKAGSAVPCTQVAGTATGCEIMVFDISSTTDPIYRAGRDSNGTTNGSTATSTTAIKVSGSALYVSKAAGATTCSATAGAGGGACEIMIFNISSTTDPQYVAGLDAAGNTSAGAQALQVNSLEVVGSTLYAVKAGSATTCNPTVGNAVGCELMVFNIASTTAPVFATGRDAGGSSASTSAIAMNFVVGTTSALYIGKAGSAVPCTGVAGTADGCGVMVFDISSTTDPIYRRGIDAGGSYTGIQALNVNGLALHKNYLYVAKAASAVACNESLGLAVGCELVVLDVASSSAIRMVAARDAGGDNAGLQSLAINALIGIGDTLYAGKAGVNTSCTATAGNAVGCELMVFDISRPASGRLLGNMVGASTLGDVTTRGVVEFRDVASTSDLTIASGTTTMPTALTVAGDYTNNAILTANEGSIYFASNTAQSLSGTMVGTSTLYRTVFAGSGTKTMSANASTSFFEVMSGATVVAPSYLTVGDTFTNNGTFDANDGTVYSAGHFNEFLGSASAGGSMTDIQGLAFNNLINVGDIVYVAKAGNATACSQVTGSAVGCELLVFDISNPSNIVYRAGRDASGSHASTSATSTTAMAIAGNTLYVAKAGGRQNCTSTASTTAGNCELLVFNIASTTNPVYVTALDAGGSNASTSAVGINQLLVVGNILYVAKAGSAVPCTQVAGTADGCELMVFDISSTTDPIYRAGRDADGNAAGTTAIAATSLAVSGNSLYMAKAAAGATACSTQANCELMVFNISSTTDPQYITGRDTSGSLTGAQTLAINNLAVANNQLFTAKANNNSNCVQTAGSAVGCELMIFDISSTSNPVFTAGRDAGGGSSGTGNIAANFVAASGTNLYLAKSGDTTACSQVAGSAIGCEVMLFDTSSSTNPVYIEGRDISALPDGRANTNALTLQFAGNSLLVGRANDVTPCEQIRGLRLGCELHIFKSPTTFTGTLTGNSGLATVTTNGLTKILAAASTTHLTVSTSSVLTAPAATLSASGNVRIQGSYQHNAGELALTGTNQLVSGVATTTFYDFTQMATAAATTTFSTTTPFVIVRNLTLRGASAGAPLILRSASTTAQWSIDPQSSSTVTLEFLDVQDSNNISATTTTLICTESCINSGNNSNWNFGEVVTVELQDGLNGYAGTDDTYLSDAATTTNFGTAASLDIDGEAPETTSLLKWDLSSIPSDVFIQSAEIVFYNVDPSNDYGIFQSLQNWTETGATWNLYDGVTGWDSPGATTTGTDVGNTQLGTFFGPGTGYSTSSLNAAGVAVIQDWVDGVVTNNGFAIFDHANTSGGTPDSSESATADQRPKLIITYTYAPVVVTASPWNDTDWTQFETITIDETNIDENLTDFPVYVDLADLSSSFWTTTPAGAALVGTDIRVTTEDNVEVPRELVFASSTIDAGELHFKAPLISATEDTVFKIWYNGTTTGDYAVDATYGAENVWTNNYHAVYHMQEDSAATTTDSTSNNFDAGPGGAGSVAGALGSAVSFSGGAKTVSNFTAPLSSFSTESWIRPTALENTGNFYTIIDLKDALYWGVRDTDESMTAGTNWDSYYTWNTSANTVVDDEFQHLYLEFDDMTDTATDPVFANNNNSVAYTDNTPTGTHLQPTDNLYIGGAFGFDPFVGDIDELRISSTTRSATWRRATYMNQSTTTDFYNVNKSVGSSTLAAHTAGQVPNAFSATNKTNESLFAFRLIPNSGNATVTAVTLTIEGVSNVVDTDFSNIRLYRDLDNDALYDAADSQVGGAGVMSIVGSTGSITFTEDFLATTSRNYLVVADFTAPINGSFMTISMNPSQITMTDTNLVHVVYGSVSSVRHHRNNKGGGGGGNSSAGGSAPAGAGDVGGGGGMGGELIGNDPDFLWPSAQSGSWSNGANAFDQTDGTYASTASVANHSYSNHGFVVPTVNTVSGIIIKLEVSGTTAAGTIDVQLSWDGGTSWTSAKSTPTLSIPDAVYTLGSPSDLWGRSWSPGEFDNANFAVRVTGNVSSNTIRLDAIQARVYHLTGGGGGGGGGEI